MDFRRYNNRNAITVLQRMTKSNRTALIKEIKKMPDEFQSLFIDTLNKNLTYQYEYLSSDQVITQSLDQAFEGFRNLDIYTQEEYLHYLDILNDIDFYL